MMNKILNYVLVSLLALTIGGCALFGIHLHVHNPKKPGKYKISKNDELLGELNELKKCYDVKFYDISIQLFPHNKSIKGKVEMKSLATTDFSKFEIDLHENLKINSITVDGKNVEFKRNESAVYVTLSEAIKSGNKFSVVVNYAGKPLIAKRPPWAGGTVWKTDNNKKPWLGVACEGLKNGSSIWFPSKDHSSDEPDSFAIAITTPRGLVGVSNGLLEKVDSATIADSTVWHWKNHYAINNYNITYYVGDFKLIKDSMDCLEGKLIFNHYVLSYNYNKAKEHFEQVKKIISFYEKTFGAYPWMKDGFKLVESPFAGMEHQSAIAYGNGYKNGDHNTDYIILHETAHEWWGNSVSAADLAHGWLHEGFATYCESLFYEEIAGKSAYETDLSYKFMYIKNKRPVVGPMNKRWFYYKDGDIYMKGTWILATLRTVINNDKIFFDILKTFYQENERSVILSDKFQELVERKTATDYDWFFNQYLYNRKTPILEYYKDYDGYLYYRWTQCNDDFKLNIKVSPTFQYNDAVRNWMKISPSTLEIKKSKLLINGYYLYFDADLKLYGTKENKKLPQLMKNK